MEAVAAVADRGPRPSTQPLTFAKPDVAAQGGAFSGLLEKDEIGSRFGWVAALPGN